MVADIEMADRPQDDSDYMEAVIQNMIDDGSQYFIDYHEIMQGNRTQQQEGNAPEQQEGNAPEQQLIVQQEEIPARYVNVNIYNASLALSFRLTWLLI